MDAFKKLQAACKGATFKKFSEIAIGSYEVHQFKFVETRFGKKVVVVTDEFMCFLPERFSKAITTDDQIDALNAEKTMMSYRGRDAGRMNFVILDFQKMGEDLFESGSQQWEFGDLITLPPSNMDQN